MSLSSIARILDILADETDDLAAIAERLDALIPELVTHLPENGVADLRDLQRIDALWQHLRDISRVLKTLASLDAAEASVDVARLIAQVRGTSGRRRITAMARNSTATATNAARSGNRPPYPTTRDARVMPAATKKTKILAIM